MPAIQIIGIDLYMVLTVWINYITSREEPI